MPTSGAEIQTMLNEWWAQILVWAQSPSFLAQLGAVALAIILAPLFARILRKMVFLFSAPPADDVKFLPVRKVLFKAGNFLRAIMLVLLLALFAAILKAIPALGQDWLVKLAQSWAVIFLIYRAIKTFISDPLFRKIATYTLIPLGLIIVLGYFDELTGFLEGATVFQMGETPITLMSLIRLGLFGALFFWLGGISNTRGQAAIRSQEQLDVGVREIVAKLFQIILFAVLTFLVMSAAGIPLSGLVVVFSAIALGIGFGLQPIAANFVSGLIILFDRSVKVGDFVQLESGFGRVKAVNMRSTTVATADGKDIIVPNTKFTEETYENWTHDSPLQRYEVDFGVSYDTDLDALVPIVRDAVLEHPDVLGEPDLPSVEFRAFGDSSINMCVEFWCQGVDDGPNKFTSDVGFIIWRTLKANKIEIPFPQRVIYQKKG